MATINLGRIKPVFRGAYSGATAYVVDDIVTSSDETFICILASTGNATSNATYWTKLAAKGTDGTDLTSTLTTQGDVVYRDGSGLARLGFGTSGHVLTTKGTGANPAWEAAVGGKVLQVVHNHITPQYSQSSTSWGTFSGLATWAITPSATSSKILIMAHFSGGCNNWNMCKFMRDIGGGGYADIGLGSAATGSQNNGHFGGFLPDDTGTFAQVSWTYLDSPSTTSAVNYQLYGLSHNPTTIYLNRTYGNPNYGTNGNTTSSVVLTEIGV